MTKVLGIDIGTTNSCVAVIEGGEPIVISNIEGARTTPSIVAIDKNGKRLVGEVAKRLATINPEITVSSIMRFMGRKYDDLQLERDRSLAPYKVVRASNGDAWIEVHGKQYSPPEIVAMILQKLKMDAEDYLGERVTQVVMTAPCFFDVRQCQAIKDAGRIAGLEVLRLLRHSTAAALTYGLDRKKDERVAIYDLGGGTLDISILELGDGVFEVKSVNGDMHLGGNDFDQRIITWLADEFRKEQGIDLRHDLIALQRLKEAVERTKGLVIKALTDANLRSSDVNSVVLVGGQTRMPAVQAMVKRIFDREPHCCVNPDEVVAIGAAIQAGVLCGDIKDVLLLDATSLSLGIETNGGVLTRMVKRNTTYPTQYTNAFSVVPSAKGDGSAGLGEPALDALAISDGPDVEVYLTTHDFLDGLDDLLKGKPVTSQKYLSHLILSGISPSDSQIEVELDIEVSGKGTITVYDIATGQKRQETIIVPIEKRAKNVLPDNLGVKGLGERFITLIERGTPLPLREKRILIALKNNLPERVVSTVEIHVLQGEREFVRDNLSFATLFLDDVPLTVEGLNQIEVTFDIDANELLSVSARDKWTGREQRITVVAFGGLWKDQIDRMAHEAEMHAAESRQHREETKERDLADSSAYRAEKFLIESSSKVSAQQKQTLKTHITSVRAALAHSDLHSIRIFRENLEQALDTLSASSLEVGPISSLKIFICYAREDEELLRELEKHLRGLRRQGLITLWHDRNISPGADWEREIDTQLNEAQIILLLVSPDFIDSDYCYGIEMKRAMERHQRGEARVIPIILRPTLWQGSLFDKLQALPIDATPILSGKWHSKDEAFVSVVEGIRETIYQLLLVRDFKTAYHTNDDDELIAAYDKLQHSSSHSSFSFSLQEQQRVQLALQRKEALQRVRDALAKGRVQEIVGASTSAFFDDKKLREDERSRLILAGQFVQARRSGKYAGIIAAYSAMQESRFYDSFTFSSEEQQLIALGLLHRAAYQSFQEALKKKDAQQIVRAYNNSLYDKKETTEQEHMQVALAHIQISIEDLIKVASRYEGNSAIADRLLKIREDLKRDTHHVVVVGFKSGKSTFLNAMRKSTTGITFIDLPRGEVSDDQAHQDIMQEAIIRSEAAIILFQSEVFLDGREHRYVKELFDLSLHCYYVVNLWNGRSVDEALKSSVWNELVGGPVYIGQDLESHDIYFVDAKMALRGKVEENSELVDASGLTRFEQRLKESLEKESMPVRTERFVDAVTRSAEEIMRVLLMGQAAIGSEIRAEELIMEREFERLQSLSTIESERDSKEILQKSGKTREIIEQKHKVLHEMMSDIDDVTAIIHKLGYYLKMIWECSGY